MLWYVGLTGTLLVETEEALPPDEDELPLIVDELLELKVCSAAKRDCSTLPWLGPIWPCVDTLAATEAACWRMACLNKLPWASWPVMSMPLAWGVGCMYWPCPGAATAWTLAGDPKMGIAWGGCTFCCKAVPACWTLMAGAACWVRGAGTKCCLKNYFNNLNRSQSCLNLAYIQNELHLIKSYTWFLWQRFTLQTHT